MDATATRARARRAGARRPRARAAVGAAGPVRPSSATASANSVSVPRGCGATLSVAEVAGDVEVREQQRVLEHVADATPLRRQRDPPCRVVQHRAVERDPAAIRRDEPRDQLDERRLAAPGASEERGHARGGRCERGFELEVLAPQPYVDLQHLYLPTRRRSARDTHSASTSPVRPSRNDIPASRAASASPPGDCSAV